MTRANKPRSMMTNNNDNDEFFGDQEEEEAIKNVAFRDDEDNDAAHDGLAEREARSTRERFRNLGYLEAYDEAKEERLQEGFEAGYKSYFQAAMRMGQVLGKATACPLLKQDNVNDDDGASNEEIKREIVREVQSFLVSVDKEEVESTMTITPESLDELTKQLQELMLKQS